MNDPGMAEFRFEFRVWARTADEAEELARDLLDAGRRFQLTILVPVEPGRGED